MQHEDIQVRDTVEGIQLDVCRDTLDGKQRLTLAVDNATTLLSPDDVDWLVGALRGQDWLGVLNDLERAATRGNVWDVLRVVARIRSMRPLRTPNIRSTRRR